MPNAILLAASAVAGFALFGYWKLSVSLERYYMSTQAAIDAVVAQLAKAKDEIVGKLEEATAGVEAQLVDAGVADVVDLSALTAIAQQLDDLVPDVAVDEAVEEGEVEEEGDLLFEGGEIEEGVESDEDESGDAEEGLEEESEEDEDKS